MTAYYNEIDPDAAHILRTLIADGAIAPGDVDTRSIKEVQPDDLKPYSQCHFFAGGGLWSVAARMAGWDDDRPLWTGSCPCQPFSHAGKGGGIDDPRHLWPYFFRLIRAGRPAIVLGEQVAGQAGYGWFDGVRADLAGEDYASRTVDIPACAVDAPHIRQRLYWVALADAESEQRGARLREGGAFGDGAVTANRDGRNGLLVNASGIGRAETLRKPRDGQAAYRQRAADSSERSHGVDSGDVAHPDIPCERRHAGDPRGPSGEGRVEARPTHGYAAEHSNVSCGGRHPNRRSRRNGSWWADHEWIACHDGKARRAQPGTPMLVDGLPGRVGLWRVAGNAISPVLAAEVIGALMDILDPKETAA